MGYTTDFEGSVSIEPPLNADEVSFLKDFNDTRRMYRIKGPLFVLGGTYDNEDRSDVVDYNRPHGTQPGLWCKWVPSDDGTTISWDGAEKFYDSEEWMQYLIDNLLCALGETYVDEYHSGDPRLDNFTFNHVVNGKIHAQGEDPEDTWTLVVEDNIAKRVEGTV